MKPTRKLSRRSFLGRVAGGAIAGGAALTILGGEAQAQGCSDSDSGPNGDPGGSGRRCGSGSGCTDSDTGQYADGVGRGPCGAIAGRFPGAPQPVGDVTIDIHQIHQGRAFCTCVR